MADALFAYVIRLADTSLVLGHRLSEWSGRGPMLEEDIAMSNMALDLIGQARSFYQYAAEIEGKGRDEDALAYLRKEREFRNWLIAEQPNGDFAFTMLRQLFVAAYLHPFYEKLKTSTDQQLAGIAAKAEKEMAYHVRHAGEWVIRLADGTDESRDRILAAMAELWPFTGEMFETDLADRTLVEAGIAVDPADLRDRWDATLDEVFAQGGLSRPQDGWMQAGSRNGQHTEHLGRLLAELQYMQRSYPGAQW